ncbi:MAG TPA: hypothetical protein VL329_03905 [Nitrospiraceae bacterium]|jgi:hypothetical protein|nr:hypothetical protein [Nitrospiraceae bacterium]
MLPLFFVTSLLGCWYGISLASLPVWLFTVTNVIGPLILLVACLGAASYGFPGEVWTPMPWFFLASAAYFGFGPLIYSFGSDASLEYVDSIFPMNQTALLRTNLLNAVGISLICLTVWLFNRLPNPVTAGRPTGLFEIRVLFWLFLSIGLTVELLLVMPYKMGLLSWTLPGSIQNLSTFSKVAIILGYVMIYRGSTSYRWLIYPLVVIELIFGLMTFYKQAVLEVLLAAGLGWSLSRPKIRTVIVTGTVVVMLYSVILTPFVSFARIAYKTMGVPAVEDLMQAVQSYWEVADEFDGYNPGTQYWWARLDYANAQAFVMDAYDHAGPKGETLALAPYAFVPRILIPSKPLISPGHDFAALMTGEYDDQHSMAPGIFAEAYWNGGWLLVGLICFYVGVLFVGFARFASITVGQKRYEYLPVVMMGLAMGYSINDWFPMVYVGSLANAVGLYFIIRYILVPSVFHLQIAPNNRHGSGNAFSES